MVEISEKCLRARKKGSVGVILILVGIGIGVFPLILLLILDAAPSLELALLVFYILYYAWWAFVLVGVILVVLGALLKGKEIGACL